MGVPWLSVEGKKGSGILDFSMFNLFLRVKLLPEVSGSRLFPTPCLGYVHTIVFDPPFGIFVRQAENEFCMQRLFSAHFFIKTTDITTWTNGTHSSLWVSFVSVCNGSRGTELSHIAFRTHARSASTSVHAYVRELRAKADGWTCAWPTSI